MSIGIFFAYKMPYLRAMSRTGVFGIRQRRGRAQPICRVEKSDRPPPRQPRLALARPPPCYASSPQSPSAFLCPPRPHPNRVETRDFAFPERDGFPAHLQEAGRVIGIPPLVALEFQRPVVPPRFRTPFAQAGLPVPEATVDEDRFPPGGKDQIRGCRAGLFGESDNDVPSRASGGARRTSEHFAIAGFRNSRADGQSTRLRIPLAETSAQGRTRLRQFRGASLRRTDAVSLRLSDYGTGAVVVLSKESRERTVFACAGARSMPGPPFVAPPLDRCYARSTRPDA